MNEATEKPQQYTFLRDELLKILDYAGFQLLGRFGPDGKIPEREIAANAQDILTRIDAIRTATMDRVNGEQSRVVSVSVERVFNLGNYENIKYHVRADIGAADNPGQVLASIENILNDLRLDSGVSDWEYGRAQRLIAEWTGRRNELTDTEQRQLEKAEVTVKARQEAEAKRSAALAALSTLNYVSERIDHKESHTEDPQDEDDLGI